MLRDEVDAGRFREDLLFRLNTIEIHLPALRDRREDIAPLAVHFLRRHVARYRKPVSGFDAGLTQEFLRAVANQAKLTLHVTVEAGGNDHHVVEAAFKAFARALRAAVALDSTITDVPSTKGLL